MPVSKGTRLMTEEILREASEQVASIIAAAKKEATTVVYAARLTSKEEETRWVKETQGRGAQVYDEILAEGKIRTKKEALQKREEIINDVFKEVEKKLRKHAISKKYKQSLVKLAVDSCKKLGAGQVVIRANKQDSRTLKRSRSKIARAVSRGASISVSFGEPIPVIGGVKVSTADGKVEIDDTFEGKLRREHDILRMKIARLLFEGSK